MPICAQNATVKIKRYSAKLFALQTLQDDTGIKVAEANQRYLVKIG